MVGKWNKLDYYCYYNLSLRSSHCSGHPNWLFFHGHLGEISFLKIPLFVYFTGHFSVNVSWLQVCLLRPATCDFFILLVSSGWSPLMGSCFLSRQSLLREPTGSFLCRVLFVPPYSEGLFSPHEAQSQASEKSSPGLRPYVWSMSQTSVPLSVRVQKTYIKFSYWFPWLVSILLCVKEEAHLSGWKVRVRTLPKLVTPSKEVVSASFFSYLDRLEVANVITWVETLP